MHRTKSRNLPPKPERYFHIENKFNNFKKTKNLNKTRGLNERENRKFELDTL